MRHAHAAALLANAASDSRFVPLLDLLAERSLDVFWVEHFRDAGQPPEDGPNHYHRVPRPSIEALVDAAYLEPALSDAHPESVEDLLGEAIASVADGQLDPQHAWRSFVGQLADAIRDYEVTLTIEGLVLDERSRRLGPVTLSRSEGSEDVVARVTRRGVQ